MDRPLLDPEADPGTSPTPRKPHPRRGGGSNLRRDIEPRTGTIHRPPGAVALRRIK
jgi:hypothetical protein